MGVRSWIYDRALLSLTAGWYREVLQRIEPRSRLLDVGIGTGGALARNASLVLERDIRVTGVDIDKEYVKTCARIMRKAGLQDHVHPKLCSIYDFVEQGWDAAYFSASFMLMPDPHAALRHVTSLLAPNGQIFFTQTFQEERSPLLQKIKPLLKVVTTVDFGKVTYEGEFMDVLGEAGMDIVENEMLGTRKNWTFRLVVCRPVADADRAASNVGDFGEAAAT